MTRISYYTCFMAHDVKFRQKILSYRKKHKKSVRVVAAHFDVGVSSVVRWIKDIEYRGKTRHKLATKIPDDKLRVYTRAP